MEPKHGRLETGMLANQRGLIMERDHVVIGREGRSVSSNEQLSWFGPPVQTKCRNLSTRSPIWENNYSGSRCAVVWGRLSKDKLEVLMGHLCSLLLKMRFSWQHFGSGIFSIAAHPGYAGWKDFWHAPQKHVQAEGGKTATTRVD